MAIRAESRLSAFALARNAVLAAAALGFPAAARATPPIDASWYIGEPLADPPIPKHFSLGPGGSTAAVIALSRILPNVLVETEGEAAASARRLSFPAGTQLFQLARQARPTFCTLAPELRGYQCLVDTDSDGRLDSVARGVSPTPTPALLRIDSGTLAPLDSAVAYRQLPREQCRQRITIAIGYYGRRRMTRRDASFMISLMSGKEGISTRMIPIYLDRPLPAEFDIGGVKLTRLVRNGKKLEFDVEGGFPTGPFDPAYGGHHIEWGL